MEKFSVKKPYTILVSVIIILLLGAVSFMNMTTDLLPSMSFPYLMVITTYPGASPERVETVISEPLESALGTVSNVVNVYSVNHENYSLVELEFEDGTDMDSAIVKVSGAVDQAAASFPEACGTPSILEISMDMMATMYVAVSREDYDIYQLSDYAEKELIPYIERQEGVASVTGVGLIEKSIQVDLNKHKVDRLNDRILDKTVDGLDEMGDSLDEANQKVLDGQAQLEEKESEFGKQFAEGITSMTDDSVTEYSNKARERIITLIQDINDVQAAIEDLDKAVKSAESTASTGLHEIETGIHQLNSDTQKITSAYSDMRAPLSDILTTTGKVSSQIDLNALKKSVQALRQTVTDLQSLIKELQQVENEDAAEIQDLLSRLSGTDYDALLEEIDELLELVEELQTITDPVAQAQKVNEAIDQGLVCLSYIDPVALQEGADIIGDVMDVLIKDYSKLTTDLENDLNTLSPVLNNAEATISTLASSNLTSDISSISNSLNGALKEVDGSSVRTIMVGVDRLAGIYSSTESAMSRLETVLKAKLPDELNGNKSVHLQIEELKYHIAEVYQDIDKLPELVDGVSEVIGALAQGELSAAIGFTSAAQELATAENSLSMVQTQYDSMRDEALENANLDQLLDVNTLAQIIYAQNFSMPAGYINDEKDHSWLLKVGEQFQTVADLENMVLTEIDDIGVIRLCDVADITVIDNSLDTYANLDGDQAVALAVYKSSTAGTNEVSKVAGKAFADAMENTPGLDVVTLMDQGDYITIIIRELLTSMALGALLAILILALFLKDVRPTIMVGISIPLSVLFTIVLMYFTDLSLNMMTLSGVALGVGMLVDNSIVVMENIIRLRGKGLSAAHSSVQGARQVSGSIIASTLTTICVFLPMIFTTGTVRELLMPMALSITYCLTASLIVALTVIPASASWILRRRVSGRSSVFERIADRYGAALDWCLTHKPVPLTAAALLLAFCIWRLIVMGIVVLPDMTGDEIDLTITTEYSDDIEKAMDVADEVMIRARSLDNVKNVGIMDSASMTDFITTAAGSTGQNGSFTGYVIPEDNLSAKETARLIRSLKNVMKGLDGEVEVSSSAMGEMTSYLSSGLSVNIYGPELDVLENTAEGVADLIEDTEGFTNITGLDEDEEPSLHLMIDRNKAASYGLTTAQIYADIANRLTTEVTSTSVTIDGIDYDVLIVDNTNDLLREDLLKLEYEAQNTSQDASSLLESMGLGSMLETLSAQTDETNEIDKTHEEDSGNDSEDNSKNDSTGSGKTGSAIHRLSEFAQLEETVSPSTINRLNQTRYITLSAETKDGYNTTVQSRELEASLKDFSTSLPSGYSVEIGGETEQVMKMVRQMAGLLALALVLIYLVMVAEFQSLLSPFIILFTIPLAFTGGMIGLLLAGEQLSMLSLMGFLVLMGTVVNNGIVFVDYTNRLRIGGMNRRTALIAAGQTRMRPILMTALTTILAMSQMIFGSGMATQMSRGMAIVIAAGLVYATFMTLFIVPVMYDIFYKKRPLDVKLEEDLDEIPDDAADFLQDMQERD